jgi:hypothetical protein
MTISRRALAGCALALVACLVLASDAAAQRTPERVLRSDCTGCHTRAHDLVLGKGANAAERCVGCHEKVHPEHKPIEAFYAGEQGWGSVHPDPMFKARVDCADCHVDSTLAVKGTARLARLDRVCTNRHGTRFAGILTRWNAGMRWRIDAVSTYVARACNDPRLSSGGARTRLDDAKSFLATVAAGGALHNVRGADALLRDAMDATTAAYTAARVEVPERPVLGSDATGVTCIGCHYGIETAKDTAFGKPFDHSAHILRGDVACVKCHSNADFLVDDERSVDLKKRRVDPRHGKTTLTSASCNECHHAPASTVACTSCHKSDVLPRAIRVTLPLKLNAKGAPTSRVIAFEHRNHSKAECASCHTSKAEVKKVATCASCHDTHHRDATQCAKCHSDDTRVAHKAQDHFSCTSCHAKETVAALTPNRAFCVSCHAKQADHKPDRECSTCHMQGSPADIRKRIIGFTR